MYHLHVLIAGRVTGVGFRYFVVKEARRLGVTGWVKNTGAKVEAVLEADIKQVEKMLKLCQEGPAGAWVKEIKILEKKKIEKASENFEILF